MHTRRTDLGNDVSMAMTARKQYAEGMTTALDDGERGRVAHVVAADDVWGDSEQDRDDMQRMGKKQEFKRNFHFWSALGFVSVYMATWEFVLTSLSVGFSDGGYAGLFWCFVTTVCCYSTIVASLAEMASMAPTAGGQYHWVSEFAPPRWQKVLSYASGWMSTLGWLASVASSNYVVVGQIEAMVQVFQPSFAFARWQFTLVMIAFAVTTIFMNTWGANGLPTLEVVCLVLHILGFFVVMIPLLVLAPKNSAADVFVHLEDNSGWGNIGTAFLISQVYVMYCNLGSDSVVHIAEEVEDSSWVVPRCMWYSYLYNVFLGVVMLVTMLFCLGPLDSVLDSDVPYLLLFNNTGSRALSLVLNIILFVLIYAGNITALATCAREVFAFSRDKFISHMNQKWNIPFNAVYVTSAGVILLSCINFGSPLAFNIIVSLSLLGLLSTYMISIGCVLLKRVRGEALPPARWSLGRFGVAINAFAFLYAAFIIVMCCFPATLPIDLSLANWSPLVWVAVGIFSMVFYATHGHKHYTAPVEFVEGVRPDGADLQKS